jgi:hypothetical protein
MTYNLERWTRPDSFMAMDSGWQYSKECFVFLGRHRDSDLLTESNFECGLAAIGGESDTVKVVRESHWAVGWVEWIAIHESDIKALECASDIMDSLSDYPVVNEDHWTELEWNAAQDMWAQLSLSERVDLCRDAGLSIYAARGDNIPQGDNGYIHESCLGY